MTGVIVRYEDAAQRFARDRDVLTLRLQGLSLRVIAEKLGCGIEDVNASMARNFGGITPEMRARAIEEDVARCMAIFGAFYERALGGNAEAAAVCIKILERHARLFGLDRPASDDSALNEAMRASKQTSSQRIRQALDRVVGN